MINIDVEYYLDCNYELHRFDEKEISNKKGAIRKILEGFGYKNDGKVFKKGKQLNHNQYLEELKKELRNREYRDFNEGQKQALEKIFDNLESIPKKELSDTIGHIFRHERRENFISDWLAYLFNQNKMGTNELFQSLFDLSGIEGEFVPINGIEREKDLVYNNEDNIEHCGRIDFFIETESAIVGIENKIGCGFTSRDQLAKYSKSLVQLADDEMKEWYLFLLYPSSNENISKETPKIKQKNVKIITYEDLIKKWETIKLDCVKSLRQMIIFEDFIKHIKEYIIMDEKQRINLTAMQFLDEKSKEIEQINTIKEAAKEQLFSFFDTKMQKYTDGEWKAYVDPRVQFIQYYKEGWEWGVHFELMNNPPKNDYSNFPPKNFYLEFHHEGKNNKKLKELSELSNAIKEKEKKERGTEYCYELNYKNEKEFEKVTEEMIEKLCDTAKKYADRVDEILKEIK